MSRGLLDTSILVARGQGAAQKLPDEAAISVLTVGELHLGVLLAAEPGVRARRLALLAEVEGELDALPVDSAVARRFAALVAEARRAGRRPKVADALIAATAIEHGLPLYTRDGDFEGFSALELVLTR